MDDGLRLTSSGRDSAQLGLLLCPFFSSARLVLLSSGRFVRIQAFRQTSHDSALDFSAAMPEKAFSKRRRGRLQTASPALRCDDSTK
jgi:hypothetical protein